MSAAMAGTNLQGFNAGSFNVTGIPGNVRAIEQPVGGLVTPATRPSVIGTTGVGTNPDGGAWLTGDSTASWGNVIVRLGLNFTNPNFAVQVRFPGTVTGGAPPQAGGLSVNAGGLSVVQTDVLPATAPIGKSTTAASAVGLTTLTLNTITGLLVGMTVRDLASAAIPAGATLAAIGPGLQVTLSTAIVAPGVANGDVINFVRPQPFTTTATGSSSGVNTLAVASVTDLAVGMLIKDTTVPGAIAPGTTIAAINALVLTLSAPTIQPGVGVGNVLQVQSVTTDINLALRFLGGDVQNPRREFLVHYEWKVSH